MAEFDSNAGSHRDHSPFTSHLGSPKFESLACTVEAVEFQRLEASCYGGIVDAFLDGSWGKDGRYGVMGCRVSSWRVK